MPTGFLGGDKTALLNRMLAVPMFADSAAIISEHYALNTIVMLVDGVNDLEQLQDFRESRRQVSVADRILIS